LKSECFLENPLCLQINIADFCLSQKNVRDEHYTKADEKRVRRAALVTVSVSFGNHLVADNVEHRAAREGKRKRKNCRRNTDREISDKRTDDLNDSREHSK